MLIIRQFSGRCNPRQPDYGLYGTITITDTVKRPPYTRMTSWEMTTLPVSTVDIARVSWYSVEL